MSKPLTYTYISTKGHIREVASSLPNDYGILLKKGWTNLSPPKAVKAGHIKMKEEVTGLTIMFDVGKEGRSGWEGKNHYHIFNPDATGDRDMYLDKDGNPVARGKAKSHIVPGK